MLTARATNSCTGNTATATFEDPNGAAANDPTPFPDFIADPAPGGRANIGMDAGATNDRTRLILDFGTDAIRNLSFPIYDVDFRDANPGDWTDIVEITALNQTTPVPVNVACTDTAVNPSGELCSFSDNGTSGTATATATGVENNSTFLDVNGIVQVSIPGPVTQVTVQYIAGGNLLGRQFIAIGTLDFDCPENPQIGIAKNLTSVTFDGVDTFTVMIQLTVENFGDVVLNNLEVFDNIVAQFIGLNPGNFLATDGTLSANPNWNGTATSNILQANQSLAVGATGTVNISFQVTPGNTNNVDNIATAEGTSPGGEPATDTSTDGLDPDGNDGDNIPDENTPTPIPLINPVIGLAKQASAVDNGNGSFNIAITFNLRNYGNIVLNNVVVVDDINGRFGTLGAITNLRAVAGTLGSANTNYDGGPTTNVLGSGVTLQPGAEGTVQILFTFVPNQLPVTIENLAIARGTTPNGITPEDTSDAGVDPDGNGNGNPNDDSDPTLVQLPLENPAIGLAKQALSLIDNGDGTFNVEYLLTMENLGDVIVNNLVLTDDMVSQFATLNPTDFSAINGSLIANPNWNGQANSNILASGQSLPAGGSGNVRIALRITPGDVTSVANLAFVSGNSPTGNPVTDISTDGIDPDSNNDGDPDESTPTPFPPLTAVIPTLGFWALVGLLMLLLILGGSGIRRHDDSIR